MKKTFLMIMVALAVISCGTKKEEVDYDLLREKQKSFLRSCDLIVLEGRTECLRSGTDYEKANLEICWKRYLDVDSKIELEHLMDSVNKYNLKIGYTTPYNFDFDY